MPGSCQKEQMPLTTTEVFQTQIFEICLFASAAKPYDFE